MASLIHLASCEGLKSELGLFALPVTQTSVDHGRVVKHRPTSILSENSPVEFVISEEGDYSIDDEKPTRQLGQYVSTRTGCCGERGWFKYCRECKHSSNHEFSSQSLVSSRSQFKQYSDYSFKQYLCISRRC